MGQVCRLCQGLSQSTRAKRLQNIGTVVSSGTPGDSLINKRVFLNPTRGWDKDLYGPESKYSPNLFVDHTLT